ncbi:MAG: hypothetical protein K8S56_10135 [Candidatus Cloacimonetes bacterium]|nr:hypothetical protein [Candidatus Cloacimonadota bacterium]
MKTLKIMITVVFVLSMLLAACGGDKAPTGPKKVYAPNWYDIPEDETHIFNYGMSIRTSQKSSQQSALADAFAQASWYVEAKVKAMLKDYQAEHGDIDPQILASTEVAIKVISKASFSGARAAKRETIETKDGRYQTFIRLAIPKNTMNKNIVGHVKNEEALYNEFKATQAFKELDKEVSE